MIKAEKVSKVYSGKSILNEVSLTVEQGEIYGLVGKNGAGKTTLLNIMSGLIEPTTGRCMINREEIHKKTIESGVIGYLPDLPSFYDYLTVDEYINFLSSAGKAQGSIISQVNEIISVDRRKMIYKLSRGNRQKLGILSALIGSPQVVLLDEPTSALDPIGRKETMEIILLLKEQGLSVVLSTHILTDLETVCDKVGFLHNGTIKREIDLHKENADGFGFEILFEKKPDQEKLKEVLNGYEYSYENSLIWISSSRNNGKLVTAKEVLWLLLSQSFEIKQFSKKSKHNLETVMEELSQS